MKSLSRRSLLGGALAGAPLLAARPSFSLADSFKDDSARKLKIIVTGGHPGDPEYGCGGTVARYTDLGHEVVLTVLEPRGMAPQWGRGVRPRFLGRGGVGGRGVGSEFPGCPQRGSGVRPLQVEVS